MKSRRDIQRELFSLRRAKDRLKRKNEELSKQKEKLEEKLEELKDLMQTHLPSRKEFFLRQEGSDKNL